MTRHFLDLDQIEAHELRRIIDRAKKLKGGEHARPLEGRSVAMIFDKPSTRTRVSFEVGIHQLGGHAVVLSSRDMQMGRGETIADTARVLSRYVDAIMIRTNAHERLLELAQHATVPVINGLTDNSHPCQVMADVLTVEEHKGPIRDLKLAYAGDGNNMVTSLVHAAVRFGFRLDIASPAELSPPGSLIDWARERQGRVTVTTDADAAMRGADAVVTDTWVSMGDPEDEVARRRELLEPYRIDGRRLAVAKPDAIFMHCLPAHRGEEVTDEVIDGPNSVVLDEAENRLHAQKAILAWCMGA